jgi:hypothetical protein
MERTERYPEAVARIAARCLRFSASHALRCSGDSDITFCTASAL